MNPKIEQIETAERAIATFTTEYETRRDEALRDGVIDAAEQADLDRIEAKIATLRDTVQSLRASLEENRRRWDALSAARAEWAQQLGLLQEAAQPDLGEFDTAAIEMQTQVEEQRWADARATFEATRPRMLSVYQAYRDAVADRAADGSGEEVPPQPAANPDQDEWDSARAAYRAAMQSLERHNNAAHATIAAEITTIKASATAAEALATGGNPSQAATDIRAATAACAATEDKAHVIAHYDAIHPQRVALVNDPNNGAVGDPLVDDLQTEIAALLADAEADAAADRHAEAIPKLDNIPPIFERRRGYLSHRSDYTALDNTVTNNFRTIDAAPAPDRAPFQTRIDTLRGTHATAKVARTGDYVASVNMLRPLRDETNSIAGAVGDMGAYNTLLSAFNTQLATMETHAGRVAVEEFYQAKLIDRDQAVAEAGGARLPTAISLLSRTTAADWTAQTAIADAYVAYIGNRDAAQAVIDEVRALDGAADMIVQCDDLMASAATQALGGDIPGAELSVAEAQTRAENARAAAVAQEALGALHDEAALDNVADDFPAALAVFTDMKTHVTGQDTSGSFAAEIAAADAPVAEAQAQIDGGSPDMALVRQKLDEGIAILQDVLGKIVASAQYQTHLAEAQTLQTQVAAANTANDSCIQPAVDAIAALITAAEAAAAAPGLDFPAAETSLVEVRAKGREALANAATYAATIQPNVLAINADLATIAGSGGNVPTYMAATTARFNTLLTDITAAMAAEDFNLAEAKSNEGAAMNANLARDIGICNNIDSWYAGQITNRLALISGGQPEVANSLAFVNRKIGEFTTAMADGAYRAGEQLMWEASWEIDAGIQTLADAGPYNTAKTATRATLDTLAAQRSPNIGDQIDALEARFTAAEALGTELQLVVATRKLNEIKTEADALLAQAALFVAYEAARAAAEAKLAEAEAHDQLAAIETTVTRLRAKYDAAMEIAAGGDPTRATTMMVEVLSGAEDAIGNADTSANFAMVADAIAASSPDSFGPTVVHILAAREAHDFQAGKENAAVAQNELTEASGQIDRAEDDSLSGPEQTASLERAMELLTQAGQLISQHTLMLQAVADARARLATLRGHAQAAYLATQLDEMEAGINGVESGATDLASLERCAGELDAIMANTRSYADMLDAHQSYVTLRPTPEVEPRLAQLEAHPQAFAIQPSINAIRTKLTEATRLSQQFDPIAALALLNEVKTLGLSAFVLAEMRANNPPSRAQIDEILARPNGADELDAMVDQLEPDAQRAVLTVAFEARFGCTINDLPGAVGTDNGADIRRFYEIMSDLPDTDTLDNDSLRVFNIDNTPRTASDYFDVTGTVSMREGDSVLSTAYTFGEEYQVGEVEDGCEPANDEPVNFFTWNTLHEVGHAVDDQHNFMTSKEGNAAFGGWRMHGSDVAPIARAAAAHFDYDPVYIEQALGGRLAGTDSSGTAFPADALPTPPTAARCSPEEWEGRRVAFIAWLNRVRTNRSPWASQSTAQQIAIGGRVYHESYPQVWSSYDLAARSRGMTAYQFRAPAEWFSELYAAYHSGKIKDSHPSAGWLSQLANPDGS